MIKSRGPKYYPLLCKTSLLICIQVLTRKGFVKDKVQTFARRTPHLSSHHILLWFLYEELKPKQVPPLAQSSNTFICVHTQIAHLKHFLLINSFNPYKTQVMGRLLSSHSLHRNAQSINVNMLNFTQLAVGGEVEFKPRQMVFCMLSSVSVNRVLTHQQPTTQCPIFFCRHHQLGFSCCK